jgi:hypothetical protein
MKQLIIIVAAFAAAFAPMAGRGQAYANGVFLVFENDTGYTVNQVYMSPHRFNHWGHDLLGDTTLDDGESTTIWADSIPSEPYDVKVVYSDGTEHVFDEADFNPTMVDRAWITSTNTGYVVFHWHNG